MDHRSLAKLHGTIAHMFPEKEYLDNFKQLRDEALQIYIKEDLGKYLNDETLTIKANAEASHKYLRWILLRCYFSASFRSFRWNCLTAASVGPIGVGQWQEHVPLFIRPLQPKILDDFRTSL